MSSKKKIAIIGGMIVVVLAIVLAFFAFGRGAGNENANTIVADNANVEADANIENTEPDENIGDVAVQPGSSTTEYDYGDENVPDESSDATVGDLEETPPSTVAEDEKRREEEIYADIASQVQWQEDGNYRKVDTSPMTDLDKGMLEANSTEFVQTLFFENDRWKRTEVMNRLVDIDYVRGDNPSSLNYDWKTNWEYSLVKDDLAVYKGFSFLEVESALRDDASCLFDVSYELNHMADDGGGEVHYEATNIYRVKMSNAGKIRDIEYVGTRQQ